MIRFSNKSVFEQPSERIVFKNRDLTELADMVKHRQTGNLLFTSERKYHMIPIETQGSETWTINCTAIKINDVAKM